MVDDFSFINNIYRTSYDICMEVCNGYFVFKEAISWWYYTIKKVKE